MGQTNYAASAIMTEYQNYIEWNKNIWCSTKELLKDIGREHTKEYILIIVVDKSAACHLQSTEMTCWTRILKIMWATSL